jgi:hypothetical protein
MDNFLNIFLYDHFIDDRGAVKGYCTTLLDMIKRN